MTPALLALALLAFPALPLQGPKRAVEPQVRTGVPYRTVAGVELALDATVPAGDGPFGAVLLVHGGAWMHGKRGDMSEFARLLARRGLACFSVSYRLAPAHKYPAQIEDCLYAVQYLRAHAAELRIDPARIGALGVSAGGHLVDLLGVLDERKDEQAADPVLHRSSRVQCVVSYFGPSLLARAPTNGIDTQPPPELFGAAPDEARADEAYAAASPLNFITPDDAPFLLIHGDADDTVPVEHSAWMDERLRAAGVESELVVIPGGGHGDFFFKDREGAYWKRTEAFLTEHLAAKSR